MGMDGATPVAEAYAEGDNKFNEKIASVTIELN
jgi:hypothetical protein